MSVVAKAGHAEHVDETGSRLGMWLFLFSELILFGGLFIIYAVYRFKHPVEFHLGSKELDTFLGTVNTLILLTSSLTVALSIVALRAGRVQLSLALVSGTILLALVFLANKYAEWSHKIALGIYPQSPDLLNKPPGEILYFGLYYVMTGLHALHVIIGAAVLGALAWMIARGTVSPEHPVRLETGGLYWHLVDIIWIFLFPLFYLIH